MKKLFVIVMALAILMLASVGIAQKVTLNMIQVFTSPQRTQILQSIIKEFEKLHPNVQINLISPPYETAYQKIYMMLSNKQPLDIVEVGDWSLEGVVQLGRMENLEPYIKNWNGAKELIPGLLKAVRVTGGKAYIIPNGVYAKALFYRPDVLAKYGITKVPQTMHELYADCVKITNPSKNQYGFDFRGTGLPTNFIDIITTSYINDIDPSNMYKLKNGKLWFKDSRAVEGLKLYVNFYKNTAPKGSINWGFNEQVNAFVSGITPFLFQDPDTTGLLNKLLKKGKYKTAPLPVGPSGKVYPSYGFGGWGIPNYSKHKELAWEFIEFFTTPKISAYFCKQYGALPVLKSVYDNDPYFNAGVFEGWKEMFKNPQKYVFTSYPLANPGWTKWTKYQQDTMQLCLLGKLSIEQMTDKWYEYWKKSFGM